MDHVVEAGNSINLTATGDIVPTVTATLLGFYVNSTSGGTLVIRKGGASGTAISGTITPAIGFHRYPVEASGLHATIAAAAIDITFFYRVNP